MELLKIIDNLKVAAAAAAAHAHGVADAGFAVLAGFVFEKVGFGRERNHFHKVKGVFGVPHFGQAQLQQEPVANKLDVLAHEFFVHADEAVFETVGGESLFQLDGLAHHFHNETFVEGALFLFVHVKEVNRKFRVEALVAANELVAKGQAGHDAALFEPVNAAKAAAEKDALHARKGHQAIDEIRLVVLVHPFEAPGGLLLDDGNGFNGVEQTRLFRRVVNVRVEQQRITLAVNIFHGDLKAVEALDLDNVNFIHEPHSQVFIDNAVAGRKKGQGIFNEFLVAGRQLQPLVFVFRQVDFFHGPKTRHGLFVKFPHPIMFNGV